MQQSVYSSVASAVTVAADALSEAIRKSTSPQELTALSSALSELLRSVCIPSVMLPQEDMFPAALKTDNGDCKSAAQETP